MSKHPVVSVIIPTYNEQNLLPRCLAALRGQTYPTDKIEIVIVDDGSKDRTLEIAKEYGAVVMKSGKKHIEASKSIGIEGSTGEYLLMIDADVEIIEKDWVEVAVKAMEEYPDAVGVQNIYWEYRKDDSAVNRYCELTGINDPFIWLLGRRGTLGPGETRWPNQSAITSETEDYFVATFRPDNLPTLGSQGYLTRRSLIIGETSWKPYFFHLDTVAELVAKGHGQFILLKRQVHHDYVDGVMHYFKKMRRNIFLFLQYRSLRTYTYDTGSAGFIGVTLLMVTVVYPLLQAIRGFLRKPDLAWFLHPLFCLVVPFIYAYAVIAWKFGRRS